MLIMAVIVFATTAIFSQILSGEPKLARSAVSGTVVSITFVLWLKYTAAKNSKNASSDT